MSEAKLESKLIENQTCFKKFTKIQGKLAYVVFRVIEPRWCKADDSHKVLICSIFNKKLSGDKVSPLFDTRF